MNSQTNEGQETSGEEKFSFLIFFNKYFYMKFFILSLMLMLQQVLVAFAQKLEKAKEPIGKEKQTLCKRTE